MTTQKPPTPARSALRALKKELTDHTDFAKFHILKPTHHLVDAWIAKLATGSELDLVSDVDSVILRLKSFKAKARRALPIANGGFQGEEAAVWKQALAQADITVSQLDGTDVWGFSSSAAEGYDTEDDALNAALQAHPEIVAKVLPAPEPIDPEDALRKLLFNAHGRLRGVSLSKASGKRGAVITANAVRNAAGAKFKPSSFVLATKDFHAQYARVVKLISDHHGVEVSSPLHAEMLGTAAAYLSHYGLSLQTTSIPTTRVLLGQKPI
ncbi:hypothetical protein [Acidovorax sp. sic0104]|uniref:hypothetical protein n=1 Tax=Acidovorax sp. sic0104 TaxID=2854784 RepID=UPI001C44501F|nr:hypothetical protein [Acidovorax sp. sic0104]MBV7542033.1 hypothetical protein [Acidovorax sp. sic0104]